MLDERSIPCPYCGETITVLLDDSAGDQRYIEDCSVCCRPIEFTLRTTADEGSELLVYRDDD